MREMVNTKWTDGVVAVLHELQSFLDAIRHWLTERGFLLFCRRTGKLAGVKWNTGGFKQNDNFTYLHFFEDFLDVPHRFFFPFSLWFCQGCFRDVSLGIVPEFPHGPIER